MYFFVLGVVKYTDQISRYTGMYTMLYASFTHAHQVVLLSNLVFLINQTSFIFIYISDEMMGEIVCVIMEGGDAPCLATKEANRVL